MNVEQVNVESLRPFEQNAKLHTVEQIEHLKHSIKEFGFTQPIVADEKGVVLIGHGRLTAARELGMSMVPVKRVEGLTEKEKSALNLVDNRLHAETGVDAGKEQEILRAIEMGEFNFEKFGLKLEEPGGMTAPGGVGEENIVQLGVYFEEEQYEDVVRRFEKISEEEPELENNTAVLMRILSAYES